MLDNETKRKIDSARDILVGKVPDPKAQVEQITTALIYKFMDDMDKESEELGGKSRFFTKEYEQYSWSKILDSKYSGFERLTLYAEAITKMSQNPHIPQLFRDIFKDAFLPYRDPETLNLFLKEINGFTYEHSEQLGNAYEYLLSILSSQGDAGQFRTPRHIIDFIVEIISPQKNETILDPACGTAGFLISAYKNILRQNTKNKLGDKLTPDEKKKLMNNFVGYDISPDMVRLSLVNMYLHSIPNPNIREYDTLTSEEKWDETYDVILANPPFMTPKGGIRPHKRFSIQANRSEVLFVDYIAEHLNINGRAGVIVPEGIIFQSANAYKALRKMLIENYLYAVVSLPAGVFNPYSGVKTSILIMDKMLIKKTKDILFVKIENDGYDLGAQRRPIDKNDLPKALEIIKEYKYVLQNGEDFSSVIARSKATKQSQEIATQPTVARNDMFRLVPKSKIAESGEYNLSGERYIETIVNINLKWEMVELEEILEEVKYTKKIQKSEFLTNGRYPIIDQSENFIAGYWNDDKDVFKIDKPVIIFGDHTRIFKYIDFDFVLGADGVKILKPNNKFIPKFLYYILLNTEIKNLGYSRHFKEIKSIKIPLPSLEIQKQIVSEIDNYQKIIDGAKQIVNNYKPTIKIDTSWEMVELEKVINEMKSGFACGESEKDSGDILHLRPMNITVNGNFTLEGSKYISDSFFADKKHYLLRKGDVLFNNTNSKELVGKTCYIQNDLNAGYSNHLTRIRVSKNKLDSKYLALILHQCWSNGLFIPMCNKWVGQAGINNNILAKLKIPLPPLEIQKQIVSQIEEEQRLIEANKKLIEIFEGKIKSIISEVWGE